MKLELSWIDYLIMIIYFLFVLGIGWFLRKYMKNANAFLEAGRSMPAWVAGLAFISTNLGALEVSGYDRLRDEIWYAYNTFLLGCAIPAMIFLAIFMMPFYYGSKARSVPEFLKLRYRMKRPGP
jgi:SSS family solute:Na+ symporter